MSNELKFGNKVIFLGGKPLTLPIAASDPGSAVNGDMYYSSGTNKIRVYQNGSWQDLATGSGGVGAGTAGRLALYPASASSVDDVYIQNSQNIDILIAAQPTRSAAIEYTIPNPGDAVAAASFVLTEGDATINGAITFSQTITADISGNAATSTDFTGSLGGDVTGTQSATAIADSVVTGKVLTGFTSGAGTVAAADTILEAINKLDGNDGLRVLKAGDTMSGDLSFVDTFGIQSVAASSTMNIGTNGNATTINIGGSGSTVNIMGTLTYVETTNLQVTDKLITLNKGGAAASGDGTGVEVEENSLITGYIKVGNTRASWDILAPAASGTIRLTPGANAYYTELLSTANTSSKTITMPNASGTMALTSDLTNFATKALDNLASVAINTSLISDTTNTDDLGSDSIEWKDLWVHSIKHNDAGSTPLAIQTTGNNNNIELSTHGTGTLNIKSLKINRAEAGASNYMEDQYLDGLTLSANVSVPTEISSSLSFAVASFDSAVVDYKIKEATTGKVRIGQFIVTCDGTITSSADQFSETAALGSASGLSLSADLDTGVVRILYNNTHASNAATMRCHIKRFRV